jgi:ribose transport system permease protein
MTSSSTASVKPAPVFRRFSFSLRDAGTLIGLIIIMAVFAALVPGFVSERNLINILQQSSINACLALGMTLVIISGGIDLSVGPTAAISAVITATLLLTGTAIPLAIYRAIALIYTGGNPVLGIPTGFRSLFNGNLFGIPTPVIIVAVVAIAAWILLKKTPIGEYLMAVGGNEEAAYVAGVPIARTKITAYVISGGLAALASLILIGRLGAAEPILGNLWELDAIAAAAIGGASLMGGKGSILGTILGAIILGAMRNGLTLMNVQAFYQLLATGLIILVAMMIDRATRGRG